MADSGVRLSQLLMSLSLATDLGFGQPAEHMLRAARFALRLGERLGLTDDEMATLFDVSVLTYVGCPVYGNEAARFGDDIDFRAHAVTIDLAGLSAMRFMLGRAGAGSPPLARGRELVRFLATGGRAVTELMATHCVAAGELADRLGLGEDARTGIQQSYARWDGRGVPQGLGRDAVALSARISHVAEACEVFHRLGGIDPAVEMVRARTGSHFDPEIANAVVVDPEPLFVDLDVDTVDALLDIEPSGRPALSEEDLDIALEAIGDFCDLRCPYFAGHNRGTAERATRAARNLHLSDADVTLIRRAALVHDVGRFGVPGTVWDKPGPLTMAERERMQMHVYYVERIFSRPEPLRRIGLLAATHHERLDGSGYHRGVGGPMLSLPARVLAAADAFHAMTQPRPHRPEQAPEEAARALRAEADRGRLDQGVVDAVLAVGGHAPDRRRRGGPAGLTAREVDVLALLAQGAANKEIARRLSISPKTVGNHIERIYTKLEVTNRASAAMRAMQHGIVGTSVD